LINEGERLRGLINEVTHQDTRDVSMDYYLAHSLADFAHLKNDIATKEAEWAIKKIEVAGLTCQRQVSFKSIINGERELRGIETEIAEMEQRLQSVRHKLLNSLQRAQPKSDS
jgi:hypothetical protein